MSNKGLVFIISGPSGVGKTTILNRFLKEDKNSTFSVSYTTRKKRPGEKDGVDYHFVTREKFEELINQGLFIEWKEVYGELYGTPKSEIIGSIEKGKDIFLDIDVCGALTVKRMIPEAVLIFIEPPSTDELLRRLEIRGEKEIAKRMERINKELEAKNFFDYTITNDSIDNAYLKFKNIVEEVRKSYGKNNC